MSIPAGDGYSASTAAAATPLGVTQIRLVDGATELVLLPSTDYYAVQGLSAPYPAVRESTDPRVEDDGTNDTTAFLGARAVSLELLLRANAAALADQVLAFCRPGRRPYLCVSDVGWAQERRLRLRIDQASAPNGIDLPPDVRKMLVQWQAPDGVWEDAAESTAYIPVDSDTTGGLVISAADGLVISATDGLVIGAGSSAGSAYLDNVGNADVPWIARLYGPAVGPRLTLDDTGQTINFTSALSIAAGEYLELDSRNRTALLLGQADASRLHYLDFAASAWWRLAPGTNRVRYHPISGAGATTQAQLIWRAAWL